MGDGETHTTGRVLVAEDDENICFAMVRALEGAGHEVAAALDGAECLEKVRTFNPDLILLDLMMPEVHGIEVLKQLRADPSTRDVGVIVCTGKSFKTEHSSATELGAIDFLVKPVSHRGPSPEGREFLLNGIW